MKRNTKEKHLELACWLYYEEENNYYCFNCVQKRLDEANSNREFSDDIDYENGEACGYMEDYAQENYQVECCKCGKELATIEYDSFC